jgi:hypothetical protein
MFNPHSADVSSISSFFYIRHPRYQIGSIAVYRYASCGKNSSLKELVLDCSFHTQLFPWLIASRDLVLTEQIEWHQLM